MVKPSVRERRHRAADRPTARIEPRDPGALIDAVRDLEAKLETVTQREREYRQAMAHLEEEVRAAGALQRALLPPEPPTIFGACANVLFRPCTEISGDIFDLFRIDEAHIGLALADATGHGIPAALLSTTVRRTFRDVPSTGRSDGLCPARVLGRINEELLSAGLDDCQFVAALFAVYDETTGVVQLARGGTPYPVVFGTDNEPRMIESDGQILGATADSDCEVTEFVLEPGELLFLYTDGIEPLIGAGSDVASLERAWRRMAEAYPAQPAVAAHADPNTPILPALDNLIKQQQPSQDDVTLITLHRLARG